MTTYPYNNNNNNNNQQGYQGQQNPFYNQPVSPQMAPPNQNAQPLFPLPQGNVYNINSTLEVANVPVGAGVSVALCLPENVMFIKTLQNGNPLFYPYKILPFSNEVETQKNNNNNSNNNNVANNTVSTEAFAELSAQLNNCIEKISMLEERINNSNKKKSGDFAI